MLKVNQFEFITKITKLPGLPQLPIINNLHLASNAN